jgi:2,3,4,5-tetrahydropyridine-2-carboxylate N-succinyltransferase
MTELKNTIEKAWNNRALLQEEATITTIRKVIDLLDRLASE